MTVARRGRRSGALAVFALIVLAALMAQSRGARLPAQADASLGPIRTVALTALLIAAAIAAPAAGLRLAGRAMRRGWTPPIAQRFAERQHLAAARLVLPRDALANPYEVAKFADGLSGLLRPRARLRPANLLGPATLALELRTSADGRVDFIVQSTTDRLPGVLARLTGTYPGLRHEPITTTTTDLHHVVRLKKARRWIWSLQTTKDYSHSVVTALVHVLSSSDTDAVVQLILTPAPRAIERRAGRAVRSNERALRDETGLAGNPGIESVTAQKDLKGAVEGVGRSYFWFDWRVATPAGCHAAAMNIAATLNELRQDNELRPRVIHIRRRLLLARMVTAAPQLIPSWRTGVLSGAEIASAWHLPGAQLQTTALHRQAVRQLRASRHINRAPTDALLRDEHGLLGLYDVDRRKGLAVLGAPGAGKSSVLLRYIGNTARDDSRAMLVVDLKEDLARDALSVIPRDRTVHYLDLARPHIGINILALDTLRPEIRADVVISALSELFGEGAVGARSDSLLRNSITAVCIVEDTPTLWHALHMLDPYDSAYRDWVIRELGTHPEAGFVRDFWARHFTNLASANPRYLSEITEAPANKLRRFLLVPSLQLATNHRHNLDLLEVIRRQEVLVINGSKDAVGEANAALFCQLFVLLVQKTLHRVQATTRDERRPVSLVIDEAHNVFTPSFATMLSESRSAGLEVVAAFQYTEQIADPRVRAGVRSLLQSLTVTRIREFEDARAVAALAMNLFSDAIRVDPDDQRRLTIDPMDIVNRPDHTTLNLWLANGQPQPPFTADTIAIEPSLPHGDGDPAEHHRREQARRGYHPHDHGKPLTQPGMWTLEPARTDGGQVQVDLTAWTERPHTDHAILIELRRGDGRTHTLAAQACDRSGRRFGASTKDVDPGDYRVNVIARPATGDPTRWAPKTTLKPGEQEQPVKVAIT